MNKKRIILAGGSGLVGAALSEKLANMGHELRILTRNKDLCSAKEFYHWDPSKGVIDESIFPADVVINLAGAGIADKKWTKERKKIIVDSRVKTTEFLLDQLKKHSDNKVHYIGSSAIGIYGDVENGPAKESDEIEARSFLSECCVEWEKASHLWKEHSAHWNVVRIGLVLSTKGGALPKILMPLKLGNASYFGNGKQSYAWIHIDDLCDMIIYLIEQKIDGTFNAVTPDVMSNKSFTKKIAEVFGKFYLLAPVPEFMLNIILGESKEMLLDNQDISSEKILESGFKFKFEKLEDALRNLKETKK